jgi:catechol 2,3-dioxygenase-like lactoylglutathione lyase family enzyme
MRRECWCAVLYITCGGTKIMLLGVDHTGIVTNDIQRLYNFYTKLPGVKVTSELDTYSGELIDRLNGYKNAKVKMFNIQIGGDVGTEHNYSTGKVEFIEFIDPPGEKLNLANNAGGNAHLSLITDSIEDDFARLKGEGVSFSCEPQEVDFGGELQGVKVVYFKDPDGRPVELMQFPKA